MKKVGASIIQILFPAVSSLNSGTKMSFRTIMKALQEEKAGKECLYVYLLAGAAAVAARAALCGCI